MNTQLRRTFYLFVAGFVSLIGVLAYWQVYARESLANNPHNGIQIQRAQEVPRGLILAGDGKTILAQSAKNGDVYTRVYPQGALYSNVVGYFSTKYGASGIEAAENASLSGSGEPKTLDELINKLSGRPQAGNNVELTLDPKLQRMANDQLASSVTGRGAVVALDPKTGDILAMASYPSYDPNNIDDKFAGLQKDPAAPLLNRATQGLYTPGSVFKIITAAAALEKGVQPSEQFVDTGKYNAGGYTVTNYAGYTYGQKTFAQALALSINTIFARIGVERVGANALAQAADDFGFNYPYSNFPLPVSPSTLGAPPSEWDKAYLAATSFGQGKVQTNVFEMALVGAAVANGGSMMEPNIIKDIRSQDGIILQRNAPQTLKRSMPADQAATLNQMMQLVTTQGSAKAAQIPGVKVAGKTGTAEVPNGRPNSWFVAFAPADNPKIAVAALVENGGDGETAALPIARNLIQAYLNNNNQ